MKMFILFIALSIIAFIIYASIMIRNQLKQIDDVLQSARVLTAERKLKKLIRIK